MDLNVDRPWRAKELAEVLGVHPRTIWRWMKTGDVHSVKRGGLRFIPADEVRRVLGAAPSLAGEDGAT